MFKSFIALIVFVNIILIFIIMNIMFIILNVNAKINEINVKLNIMLDNIFSDNKNNYELLNMFKSVINDDDKRIRFRICKIE